MSKDFYMKKIYIKDLIVAQKTSIYVWIANKREHKNNLFLDVYDSTGKMECYANLNQTKNYENLCKLARESCVELFGELVTNGNKSEFKIDDFVLISASTLKISPYPNEAGFNVLDEKHARQVIEHPTFYIRNRDLCSLFYIIKFYTQIVKNIFCVFNAFPHFNIIKIFNISNIYSFL